MLLTKTEYLTNMPTDILNECGGNRTISIEIGRIGG